MSSTLLGTPDPTDDAAALLIGLRAEIDRLDDAIHDLLMARAEVVAQVSAQGGKGRVALRPGREAEILRRLLRRHRGHLPRRAVVRVWRELLAATTSMQGPYAITACETEAGNGYAQCAREHFGALTPLHVHRSPAQAIAEVSAGTATAAVLPLPAEEEAQPWWTALLHRADRAFMWWRGCRSGRRAPKGRGACRRWWWPRCRPTAAARTARYRPRAAAGTEPGAPGRRPGRCRVRPGPDTAAARPGRAGGAGAGGCGRVS